jgi:hypothetical protein
MFTVPKSVSGTMPPLLVQHGASTMTSAEERAAPRTVTVVVWLQLWVVSAMYRLNLLLPA